MTSAAPGGSPLVIGLRRAREVLAVALDAGRHVVIEGPPGTGKSTLLRAVARAGGGISQPVGTLADMAPALHRMLS